MFKFLRIRRARTVVEQVAPGLVDGLKKLTDVERSCTMAIANAMLLASSSVWGKAVLNDPFGLDTNTATDMVMELASNHAAILRDVLEPLQKRNMGDVMYAQAMRQIRAVEIVLVTVGVAVVPEAKRHAREAWKVLWESRHRADDAASTLIEFSKHAKTRPLPPIPGMKVTRVELVKFSSAVPPFLRKKKPVPVPTPVRSQSKVAR